MAELADAYGSGTYESNFMQVQVLLSAPIENLNAQVAFGVFYFFCVPTGIYFVTQNHTCGEQIAHHRFLLFLNFLSTLRAGIFSINTSDDKSLDV